MIVVVVIAITTATIISSFTLVFFLGKEGVDMLILGSTM